VPLEQALLEILVCPIDKGELLYFQDEDLLYNPRLRRRYWVRNGVPEMLVRAADEIGDADHAWLLSRAEDGAVIRTLHDPYPDGWDGGMDGPGP
jgi:uncharacterized protein YbaR (Trm112 family)